LARALADRSNPATFPGKSAAWRLHEILVWPVAPG
jgi:hypothetical protein